MSPLAARSVLTLAHPLQVGEGAVGKGFPQVQHFNGCQHTQSSGWGLLPKSLGLQGILKISGPSLQKQAQIQAGLWRHTTVQD